MFRLLFSTCPPPEKFSQNLQPPNIFYHDDDSGLLPAQSMLESRTWSSIVTFEFSLVGVDLCLLQCSPFNYPLAAARRKAGRICSRISLSLAGLERAACVRYMRMAFSSG